LLNRAFALQKLDSFLVNPYLVAMNQKMKSTKLSFLAFFFFVLLNYPLLSIADKAKLLGGLPVLYIYVFSAWVFFIGFVYRIVNKK